MKDRAKGDPQEKGKIKKNLTGRGVQARKSRQRAREKEGEKERRQGQTLVDSRDFRGAQKQRSGEKRRRKAGGDRTR